MNPAPVTGSIGTVDAPAAQMLELVRWHEVSEPVDHGTSCCAVARRWLGAIHAAGGPHGPLSGLGWISEMYPWGPSRWPMSWCSLVEQQKLDCGAHSAVATEVARGSGVDLLRVQLLLRAAAGDISHWGAAWREEGVTPTWLFDELYYHEAVATASADGLLVLDTTRNARVPSDGCAGNGSLVAIRVPAADAQTLRWGRYDLVPGQWTIVTTLDP